MKEECETTIYLTYKIFYLHLTTLKRRHNELYVQMPEDAGVKLIVHCADDRPVTLLARLNVCVSVAPRGGNCNNCCSDYLAHRSCANGKCRTTCTGNLTILYVIHHIPTLL